MADLRRIRASGGATGERSYYPALSNLLNSVGGALRPKVFCVGEMAQQGAGHPDFGLYAAKQVQKGQPKEGQLPECGVVEVKPAGDDAWLTADSEQVSTYWNKYRLVLVTNTRDFVLLGEDAAGKPVKLETFRLAESADAFEARLQTRAPLRVRSGRGAGRVPVPGAVAPRDARRAEGRGVAAGLLCARRVGASRGGRRRPIPGGGAFGVGGGAGRALRGREGRGVLPLDAGADALLRRFLRLGVVGAADAGPD